MLCYFTRVYSRSVPGSSKLKKNIFKKISKNPCRCSMEEEWTWTSPLLEVLKFRPSKKTPKLRNWGPIPSPPSPHKTTCGSSLFAPHLTLEFATMMYPDARIPYLKWAKHVPLPSSFEYHTPNDGKSTWNLESCEFMVDGHLFWNIYSYWFPEKLHYFHFLKDVPANL